MSAAESRRARVSPRLTRWPGWAVTVSTEPAIWARRAAWRSAASVPVRAGPLCNGPLRHHRRVLRPQHDRLRSGIGLGRVLGALPAAGAGQDEPGRAGSVRMQSVRVVCVSLGRSPRTGRAPAPSSHPRPPRVLPVVVVAAACSGPDPPHVGPVEAPLAWAVAWPPAPVSGRSRISASRARATWTLRSACARLTSACSDEEAGVLELDLARQPLAEAELGDLVAPPRLLDGALVALQDAPRRRRGRAATSARRAPRPRGSASAAPWPRRGCPAPPARRRPAGRR